MLTPEQITTDLIGTPESHPFRHLMVEVVRKVMDEVRKDDDALIRQMLEHLEVVTDEGPDGEGWQSQDLKNTITAARARLEKAP